MSGRAPAAPLSSWGPRAGGTDPLSLHRARPVELFPSGLQQHQCLPSSVGTWAGAKGLMCSGTPALVESLHFPSPQLKNQVSPLLSRHLSQEFPIPFPRKELVPRGCIALWEASDSV